MIWLLVADSNVALTGYWTISPWQKSLITLTAKRKSCQMWTLIWQTHLA